MDVRTTSRASFVSGGFRTAQVLGRGLLTYRCVKRHLQCIALSFVTAAFMASSLEAQQRHQVTRPRDRRIPVNHSTHQPNRENTPQLLVEPSAPIANLFTRAQDGITRADWKFATDCLQRIIDNPGNSLVRRSSGATEGTVLYESVRRSAVRRLGSLPPEGLRRYRLLYDGKAKRLYEQGRAAHNPERLRVVVDRYLLTRYGDDAADLLASWTLDEGRPNEAIQVLTDVLELVPDSDVPERRIAMKLAAAYSMLGQTNAAASAVRQYLDTQNAQPQPSEPDITDSVLRFRPLLFEPEEYPTSWPLAGGSSARRGRMPAVDPALSEAVPWRFLLPGAAADTWRRMLRGDPSGGVVLPVGQLVAEDGRLFARTRRGCVALDVVDLSVRWEFPELDIDAQAVSSAGRRTSSSRSTQAPTDAGYAFNDYVAGGISLGHGLVMIVSREGRSEYMLAERDAGRSRLLTLIPRSRVATRNVLGTRLVALDAKTGRIQWERGRSGNPNDPLCEVDFRSVPIAVGDALWVPFLRQRNLHAAVLRPEDGSLIRSIPLCSVGEPAPPARYTLQPAATDDVVFVPSGHGMLFAISTRDYTVRWANQYGSPADERGDSKPNEADGWLPSPPVVGGGLVLLAPRVEAELLAFSAANGEFKWSTSCRDCSYIIGADHERVWLGGRSVYCLSLPDGKPIWNRDIQMTPAGRGVLSDQRIYVPALEGLLSLRATTGEVVGHTPTPASHGPLGNLLCLAPAMFSINASSVRKYPDIGRSYLSALTDYETDPSNPAASILLAWLELLRGEPQRAYDVLEAIPPAVLAGDERRAKDAARVQVETLLRMAGRSGDPKYPDDKILALLEEAGQTARASSDRLRCTLAIADQLSGMGRYAEAFQRLWELGICPDGDRMIAVGDHVEEVARSDIARRLRRIAGNLSNEQFRALHEHARARIDEAAKELGTEAQQRPERLLLQAAAALQVPGPIGQRAVNELAAYHAGRSHYEQAEQLFRQSVRQDSQPELTIAALMQLCQLYASPASAGLGLIGALASSLDELETRFAAAAIPQAIADSDRLGDLADGVESVADWVQQLRSRLSIAYVSSGRPSATDVPIQLTGKIAWFFEPQEHTDALRSRTIRVDVARLVSFGEHSPAVLADRIILHDPDDVLYCHRVDDGELLWRAALRLPETFTEGTRERWRDEENVPRRAVSDGQTAVFSAREGIFAVGLATGRRIWIRPYETAEDAHTPYYHDTAMAADEGFLAAMPKPGRLTLMRMLDGSTIWERDLLGERVEFIWMIEDRVVTADALLERIHLFDRASGQLAKRVLFEQHDPENQLIRLIRTAGLLCGPTMIDGNEGVAALDVTDGEIAWRLNLDKPLIHLFKLQEGYLGVALLGGDLRIVDASTGEVVLAQRVAGAHTVVRGTLINGNLLVQHYPPAGGILASELTALDIATGTELWHRTGVNPLWRLGRPLRTVGGSVPVVIRHQRTRARMRTKVCLAMVDARTGSTVGAEVTLRLANQLHHFNGDFDMFVIPGRVVVGTDNGIYVLGARTGSNRDEDAVNDE